MQSPPATPHTDASEIPLPPSPCPSLSTSSSASPPPSPSPSLPPSSPSFPSPPPIPSSSSPTSLPHPPPHPRPLHTHPLNPTTTPNTPITDHDRFYLHVQLPIILRLLRFRARYLHRDSQDASTLMNAVDEYLSLVDRVIAESSTGSGDWQGGAGFQDRQADCDDEEYESARVEDADAVDIVDDEQRTLIADERTAPSTPRPVSAYPSHTLSTDDLPLLLSKTLLPSAQPESESESETSTTYMHTHARLLDGWAMYMYTTQLLRLAGHTPRASEIYRAWEALGHERQERFVGAVFGVAAPRGLRAWVGSVVGGGEGMLVGGEDGEIWAVEGVMGEIGGEWDSMVQGGREGDGDLKEKREDTARWDRCGRAYAREALFGLRREALLEKLDAWIACIALPESESEGPVVLSVETESRTNAGVPGLRRYLLDHIPGLTEDIQGGLSLDMDVNAWVDFLAALLFRCMDPARVPVSVDDGPRLRRRGRDLSLLGVLLARDRLEAVLEGRHDEVVVVMRMQVAVLVRRLVLELVGALSVGEGGVGLTGTS